MDGIVALSPRKKNSEFTQAASAGA